jgi:hypothetical protein
MDVEQLAPLLWIKRLQRSTEGLRILVSTAAGVMEVLFQLAIIVHDPTFYFVNYHNRSEVWYVSIRAFSLLVGS